MIYRSWENEGRGAPSMSDVSRMESQNSSDRHSSQMCSHQNSTDFIRPFASPAAEIDKRGLEMAQHRDKDLGDNFSSR
jgi:hypothetical protein